MWFRFVIALAILAPVMLVEPHRPWWMTFVLTLAAFGAGRLMEAGAKAIAMAQTRARGIAMIVAGLLVAAAVLVPVFVLHRQRQQAAAGMRGRSSRIPLHDAGVPVPTAPVQRAGTWRAIAMADRAACAVRADGTVWCWGLLSFFGNDEPDEPRQIDGLAGVTAIGVGDMSVCALVDRHAWCFGWNYTAALGVPAIDTHDVRTAPVRVPVEAPLTAVAVGFGHACALTDAGEVWCWGWNRLGEVGASPASEQDQRPPMKVSGLPAIRALAAGGETTCAIGRDDDQVWCWGDIEVYGPVSGAHAQAPTAMAGLEHATAIAVATGQACAIVRDGDVWCWGGGSRTPKMHDGSTAASAIAVGDIRVCTARGTDTRCWPFLHEGVAKPVADLPALTSLASCALESCGLTAMGELWCWDHHVRRGLIDRRNE